MSSLRTLNVAVLPKTFAILLHLAGGVAQNFQLFGHGDFEGILLVRGLPAVAVLRHGSQFDRLRLDGRVGLRDDGGFARDARDFGRRDDGRGGEAPGPVNDNTHAEAEAGVFGDSSARPRSCRSPGPAKGASPLAGPAAGQCGCRNKWPCIFYFRSVRPLPVFRDRPMVRRSLWAPRRGTTRAPRNRR